MFGVLIKGKNLNADQRRQVLNAFVHRHLDTTSKTDDEWIKKHAFHFTKDGKRLARNRRYAEPEYAADFAGIGKHGKCKYGKVKRGPRTGLCRVRKARY